MESRPGAHSIASDMNFLQSKGGGVFHCLTACYRLFLPSRGKACFSHTKVARFAATMSSQFFSSPLNLAT